MSSSRQEEIPLEALEVFKVSRSFGSNFNKGMEKKARTLSKTSLETLMISSRKTWEVAGSDEGNSKSKRVERTSH